MTRLLLTIVLLTWLPTTSFAEEKRAEPPLESYVALEIKLMEQRPAREKPVCLGRPMVMCMPGHEFSIQVGGTTPSKYWPEEQRLGFKCLGKVTSYSEHGYEVKLSYSNANVRKSDQDPDTEIFTETSTKLRTLLQPTKTKSIQVDPTHFLELTLQKAPPRSVETQETAANE
ncbi:hypothetical protein AB1L30_14545 [Bremerella sp. JC817]|uniref:hypothetical protein n=1 Tax=Bremerella sp. JC817 TaxID=3231756 RepID=UPI0034575C5A